jgi:hypothetical protein
MSVEVLRVDQIAGRAPTILLKFEPGSTCPATIIPEEKQSSCWREASVSAKILSGWVTTCTQRRATYMPLIQRAAVSCWGVRSEASRSRSGVVAVA